MEPIPPRPSSSELETKITFLERTVEALNEVVLAQSGELERLGRRLAALEGRLAGDLEDGDEPFDLAAEKPPHY